MPIGGTSATAAGCAAVVGRHVRRARRLRALLRRRDHQRGERRLEAALRLLQRHAILRPPRSGQARLDVRKIELDRLGVDRIGIAGAAEQPLRLGVRLDQLRPATPRGRSAAGSRASSRRSGRSRSSRRTPGTCCRASRDRRSSGARGPGPKNSTNLPTTPCLRSRSVIVSTRSVAVAPSSIAPVRRNAEHRRDQHRDRLAEHRRLGLDAADAPAHHAEPVHHRRVRVGADERVGIGRRVPSGASADITTRARYSRFT